MGFRRQQKAHDKKRSKDKDAFNEEQQRNWKRPDKKFKKYKKIKWSDDDIVTEA